MTSALKGIAKSESEGQCGGGQFGENEAVVHVTVVTFPLRRLASAPGTEGMVHAVNRLNFILENKKSLDTYICYLYRAFNTSSIASCSPVDIRAYVVVKDV